MVGSIEIFPANTVIATTMAPITLVNEHRNNRCRRGREKRSRTSERGNRVITASHATENLSRVITTRRFNQHARSTYILETTIKFAPVLA